MNKIFKIGFPIVCLAIIIFTFWLMSDMKGKVETRKENENKSIEADVNNSFKNQLNLEVQENEINNELPIQLNNEVGQVGNNEFFDSIDDVYLNKSIQVLKNNIEIKDNQYFTSEGEENGRYIVALRDKETTEAEIYYIVNVETGEYEIYY